MKRMSDDTPGGRIRKIRLEKDMTVIELAARLGITSGYLGLVEREDRKPSTLLLKKVASEMNVSFDWLKNGDSNNELSSVDKAQNLTALDSPEDVDFFQIDARVFLTLLMAEDADMNPKNLALILHADEADVNAVLNGEHPSAARKWASGFSALAQRLDMPAMSQKLKTLAAYLDKEERIARDSQMWPLIQCLKDSAEAKGHQNLRLIHSTSEKKTIPYYCMKFQGDGGWCWEFRYVQNADMECIDALVEAIMGNLPIPASLSIVFDNKVAYETFSKLTSDYIKKSNTIESPAYVSAMLIDGETYAVLDEKDCWSEDVSEYME